MRKCLAFSSKSPKDFSISSAVWVTVIKFSSLHPTPIDKGANAGLFNNTTRSFISLAHVSWTYNNNVLIVYKYILTFQIQLTCKESITQTVASILFIRFAAVGLFFVFVRIRSRTLRAACLSSFVVSSHSNQILSIISSRRKYSPLQYNFKLLFRWIGLYYQLIPYGRFQSDAT